mgnify:CR=1 FL=1
MAIEVRKKEGENIAYLLYRFNKKVKQSGVLKEVKKHRFRFRRENKRKIKLKALYRNAQAKKISQMKKMGYL